jgi:hypothetical protein
MAFKINIPAAKPQAATEQAKPAANSEPTLSLADKLKLQLAANKQGGAVSNPQGNQQASSELPVTAERVTAMPTALALPYGVANNTQAEAVDKVSQMQQATSPSSANTTNTTNNSITNSAQQLATAQIEQRIKQLEADLKAGTPQIAESLRIIHRALLEDPEQVTILTDEQRAIFFQGLMKQTATVITTTASKTRQSSKKEFKDISLDDLL